MKISLFSKLGTNIWIMAALVLSFNARGQVTFSDLGVGVTPTPGAYDIFQLSTNGEVVQPDSLNYTTDNGSVNGLFAGQTFTTGSNCAGYTLNSLAIYSAGLSNGGGYATSQSYDLYVYAYSGLIFYPIASFQAVGSFVDGDWVQWSGLASAGLTLSPNTQYAYTFGRDAGQGFAALGNAGGNPYSGGELVLIPAGGGSPVSGSSHGYDATFDIGLTAIAQAPSITVDPSSESVQVYPGHQVVFSVGVCPSAAPLSYQWMLNGARVLVDMGQISGSQTATLSIAGVTATNAGSYSVIVSNASGSVPSGSAILSVLPLPAANTYASTVLSNSPIAYYPFNEIAGPTAYEFINGDNGTYQPNALVGQAGVPNPPYLGFTAPDLAFGCDNTQVSSWALAPFGSLGVSNVTFTCWVNPSGSQNGRTGLIFERSSIYTGGGGGMGTIGNPPILGYTWNENSSATFNFEALNLVIPTNTWSLCGMSISPTQAVLYVLNLNGFNAATNAIPHTPDSFPNTWEIGNDAYASPPDSTRTFNGDIEAVAIFTNSLSYPQMVALFQAGYAASMPPPNIITQPVPEVLYPGGTAQFSVAAGGLGTLSYHWLFNSTPLSDGNGISGSTNAALVIRNVASANVGAYSVTVANQGGSTNSSSVTLSLTSVSTAYEAAMTNLNPVGYWRFNEVSGAPYAFDYWGGFTATYGSAAVNGQSGPQSSTFPGFEANNDCVQTAAVVNSWVMIPPLPFNTNTVTITAWVYPTSSEQGSAAIVCCRGGATDSGLTCTGSGGTHIGYTWNNVLDTYRWLPPLAEPLNMWSFCAMVVEPTRTTMYVFNPNTTVPGAVNCAVNLITNAMQSFNYTTYVGTDILGPGATRNFKGDIDEVAIFNRALSSSELTGLYTTATGTPLAPAIQLQPQATGVYSNDTAELTVIADGSGPISYQWQLNGSNVLNGSGIWGANMATLTLSNATAGSAGTYSVIISNAYGSVTSAPTALTVGTVTSSYERAVLALGPLAYYRLNETNGSSIADDYAGGFDGSYAAAAVAGAAGVPNPPFLGFETNNTAVQLPALVTNSWVLAPFGPLGFSNVTIMCWCYPIGVQNSRSTLVFTRGAPAGAGGLQYLNTTTLGYTWNNNSSTTYSYNSGLAVPSNTWSMCAMVVSPSNCVLYLFNPTNGLRSATNAIAHTPDQFGYPGIWRIGDDSSIANGGHGFMGRIDEVAVFPASLTRSQLLNLCQVATSPALTTQLSGPNLTLSWNLGTLRSAPAVTGPWTPITTNSPYTATLSGTTQQYYRVSIP
jgi:hypothetical protein